ncbi:ArsR family transcriptional regulator [Rhodococcus sp. Leaf7]|uniref:ArsR/SmtB family transcription factor n=1 Tax=unclassified Rhodococcus (in: high G+C Gram-positive bacteria) TaxID=192944 RepID=UPI0006FA44A8|nr:MULTISPECIES: winged helix-turn-helix domain-containing protein [unclassified Rhodococcus (in: high G+C Gram-positive bacteria)]KQU06918.1 ArsR family transcriptional regulator [Rhodococcus sp. Leaf7]KQU42437.1 ArsR family transcriptional regulator [Rhodococcus sp. Leaf247]
MNDEPDLAERVAALEARVAALEGSGGEASPGTGGSISYAGDVHLSGDVSWSIGYSPDGVLNLPPDRSVEVLAALGHPVRFAVVRALLHGPATATDLQSAVGLSSVGQLYHHLKTLTSARVVEQHGRGDYRLAPKTVVPALVLMLASADVAGELTR